MRRDERIYAFIVAHSPHARLPVRRFAVRKRWLKLSAGFAALVLCAAAYGLYSLARQAEAARLERENTILRQENEKQRQQLDRLENRVEAVEDATRRLTEFSDDNATAGQAERAGQNGVGGPHVEMDAAGIADVEARAARLEEALRQYEQAMRERVPSLWPTEGRVSDGYGGRGNPFGGSSGEFHGGLDIATAWGTTVVAAGGGTVSFAGMQGGYGQVVMIDHGNGLSTRYGHLSRIDVAAGQ